MQNNTRRTVLATSLVPLAMAAMMALLPGCATKIKASTGQNPPPAEAFSNYGRIVVKHVVFKEGYRGDAAGLAKIDENIQHDLAITVGKWNQRPVNGRTLVFEPVIEEMSFKHGASRVLLGPLVGSSGVLMRMTARDGNGAVVAAPEFFQRTQAMSGGFTMGVMDNLMLTRVAKLTSDYVLNNFERAQGGPTGADDQAIAK